MGQTVDQGFAVLELLASQPRAWSGDAVALHLGLTRRAAQRVLAALCDRGYVRRREPEGDYQLALKIAAIGLRHLAALGEDDVAQLLLRQLAAECGELVQLGRTDAGRWRWRWLGAAESRRRGLWCQAGTLWDVPLHATAAGLAWLAMLEAAQARAHAGPHAPAWPRLLRRLQRVRVQGWAMARDSEAPGIASLAAPVREPSGAARACLCITGPSVRLTEARMRALAPMLLETAAQLAACGSASPMLNRGTCPPSR